MVSKIRITIVVLIFTCLAASAFPAEKPGTSPRAKEAPRPAEPGAASEDPLGRDTPQGTVVGFIKSAAQGNYERALQYLDTKKTGPSAQKLISALQIVLDQGFSGKPAMLSSKPEGDLDDQLPPSRERIGTVRTSADSLDIFLDRIQHGSTPPHLAFLRGNPGQSPGDLPRAGGPLP